MRLKLIRIVALLIALIVPVQGMAVVVATLCTALGHHQEAVDHVAAGDSQETQVDHDHSAHSHHDGAGDTSPEGAGTNGSHCGPCTACCASASISGPVRLSIPAGVSAAPYVFFQSPPFSVQLDGLDRPPTAL